MEDKHPHACWIAGGFRAVQAATADEDLAISAWLLNGARCGLIMPVPPGPSFPPTSGPPGASIDDLFVDSRNHPRSKTQRGFARRFPNRAAADAAYGPMHTAPPGERPPPKDGRDPWGTLAAQKAQVVTA